MKNTSFCDGERAPYSLAFCLNGLRVSRAEEESPVYREEKIIQSKLCNFFFFIVDRKLAFLLVKV